MIDRGAVQSCYEKSFASERDTETYNNLLSIDAIEAKRLGIYLHPGMTINNMSYRGYIEGKDI